MLWLTGRGIHFFIYRRMQKKLPEAGSLHCKSRCLEGLDSILTAPVLQMLCSMHQGRWHIEKGCATLFFSIILE